MTAKQNFEFNIGKELYYLVLPQIKKIMSTRELNLFLIGKNLNDMSSFRTKIYNSLKNRKEVNVYFPEHIFVDELFHKKKDLLSLESVLAESVHAVVMCVESAGAIAELGAFANHNTLKNKLVVYMDKKHSYDKSFIRMGPIKFLDNSSDSKVTWHDFHDFSNDDRNTLISNIRKISKPSDLNVSISNPIAAERFLLSLLYVFSDYSRKGIISLLKHIDENHDEFTDIENIITIVSAALSMLLKRAEVTYKHPNYYITNIGINKLEKDLSSNFVYTHLDRLRLTMLNSLLRKYWNRRSS